MLGAGLEIVLSRGDRDNEVQPDQILQDPRVIPHLANVLALLSKTNTEGDIRHLSNLAKQTQPKLHSHQHNTPECPILLPS